MFCCPSHYKFNLGKNLKCKDQKSKLQIKIQKFILVSGFNFGFYFVILHFDF